MDEDSVTLDLNAVGAMTNPQRRSWTSKDSMLYAVGVGAGHDPLDELAFTTANSDGVEQLALPTMAVLYGFAGGLDRIGEYDRTKLVHGGQMVQLHRPFPAVGELEVVGEITGIYDQGSGALIEITSRSTLVDDQQPLVTTVGTFFLRGAGGFGGERRLAPESVVPDREPDEVVKYSTRPEQALIYRLTGDRNPMHSDPKFAGRAGFDRPILHGLCTDGFVGRALLRTLCGGDPGRFRSMGARFSKPVIPGDELSVMIWCTDVGAAVFRAETADGRIVLDNGVCSFG